ncbi:fimbrial protein [Serratia sp. D1N4]
MKSFLLKILPNKRVIGILSITLFFGLLSQQVLAVRACNWIPGQTLGNQNIDIPSASGIVAVNDGKYPNPTNNTYANVLPNAGWGMSCTAPVLVTPVLYTHLPSDVRFTNSGYPNLQRTSIAYYSAEMWYNSPAGDKVWFTGLQNNTTRGATFILAANASPSNPVVIRMQDFGIQNIGFQGYQAANANAGTINWGTGGLLQYMSFQMVNYTSSDNTAYNDFVFYFYIQTVNFLVRTCGIISNDLYKTVNLGNRISADFSSQNVGATTTAVPFQIGLRCLPNTAVTYRVNANQRDTVNDPNNSLGLIALNGSNVAKGFSLQLSELPFGQAGGQYLPINFGRSNTSSILAIGDAVGSVTSDVIRFSANYYRTANAQNSLSGTANATATIDINYQ